MSNYEKFITDNNPKSAKELSKLLREKQNLLSRLKQIEEQEAFLNKIVPLEKQIVSWQYSYTKEAKEEMNPIALQKQIESANISIPKLKRKVDAERTLTAWRSEYCRK